MCWTRSRWAGRGQGCGGAWRRGRCAPPGHWHTAGLGRAAPVPPCLRFCLVHTHRWAYPARAGVRAGQPAAGAARSHGPQLPAHLQDPHATPGGTPARHPQRQPAHHASGGGACAGPRWLSWRAWCAVLVQGAHYMLKAYPQHCDALALRWAQCQRLASTPRGHAAAPPRLPSLPPQHGAEPHFRVWPPVAGAPPPTPLLPLPWPTLQQHAGQAPGARGVQRGRRGGSSRRRKSRDSLPGRRRLLLTACESAAPACGVEGWPRRAGHGRQVQQWAASGCAVAARQLVLLVRAYVPQEPKTVTE